MSNDPPVDGTAGADNSSPGLENGTLTTHTTSGSEPDLDNPSPAPDVGDDSCPEEEIKSSNCPVYLVLCLFVLIYYILYFGLFILFWWAVSRQRNPYVLGLGGSIFIILYFGYRFASLWKELKNLENRKEGSEQANQTACTQAS